MTPEDVLFVLNGCEPVDLAGHEFAVATEPDTFSMSTGKYDAPPKWWPFEKGEMLVLAEHGREPFGEMRKPDKWGVTFEYFDNLADAMACRARVLAAQPAGEPS